MLNAYTCEGTDAEDEDEHVTALLALDCSTRAQAMEKANLLDEARDLHLKAAALGSGDPNVLLSAGAFALRTGNFADAIDLLQRAKDLGGYRLGVDFKLAQAFFRAARYSEAHEVIDDALRFEPDRPGVLGLRDKIAAKLAKSAITGVDKQSISDPLVRPTETPRG